MPETSHPVLLLVCAVLVSLASMTWLALSMQVHAQQVWGTVPSAGTSRVLRGLGAIGIVIALVLCLAVDHATMATLVWVMLATGSALLVAFTLSWQPQRLRLLAPWVR
ncbi:MAG TPA: DUF3325 domain-containing protein [Pseudoxanthomonas sp.]|nr:DUF3325 domain-containing protein [Pseudoxanthomonas sp.]